MRLIQYLKIYLDMNISRGINTVLWLYCIIVSFKYVLFSCIMADIYNIRKRSNVLGRNAKRISFGQ